MTILKPERSHCYINWMRLEIELPPIGVVSYQAFQRVARGVLNFEAIPRLVFPTLIWLFSLACWFQLSWNYCWHDQEQILKKSSYISVLFSPSYEWSWNYRKEQIIVCRNWSWRDPVSTYANIRGRVVLHKGSSYQLDDSDEIHSNTQQFLFSSSSRDISMTWGNQSICASLKKLIL